MLRVTFATAAEVLDVVSRLPRCSGQANDAQAHTQVKMKGTPELHLSEGGLFPRCGSYLQKQENHTFVPLERHLYGRPFAGLLWERQFEKLLLEREDGKKFPDGSALLTTKDGRDE